LLKLRIGITGAFLIESGIPFSLNLLIVDLSMSGFIENLAFGLLKENLEAVYLSGYTEPRAPLISSCTVFGMLYPVSEY
jgi:hypothetical protein